MSNLRVGWTSLFVGGVKNYNLYEYSCYITLEYRIVVGHSIANSSLFPTSLYLHSNSTQILALKKNGFSEKKIFPKKKIFFFYLFSMQLFSADAMVFSKKN